LKNQKVKAQMITNGSAEHTSAGDELDYSLEQKSRAVARQKQTISLGLHKNSDKYSKVTDQIAMSDHWMRNEPIPGGLDLFPPDSHLYFMRFSDLFYPHAKDGPLYIDTPGSPTDIMYCEEKLKAYRKKGVRYTYVKANEGALEAMVRLDPPTLPKGAMS